MAASTSTIDPRPSYFGDRMIITGSYTAGDTGTLTIDLSSQLASIDFAGTNGAGALSAVGIFDTGGAGDAQDVHFNNLCVINGSSILIASGNAGFPVKAGTFIAIGRRS
tara:strand:+ start:1719 stop:2045 length:327 start_codon:yes stop_codon:yes gene_type:complete